MRFDLFSSSFFQNAGRQLCFRPAFFLSRNRPMKSSMSRNEICLATTIHEAGAAYTVSTSSLTMEVEAVTRALRSARRLSLKGRERATVRRTLDRFQRQRWENFRDGVESIWAFPSAQIPS